MPVWAPVSETGAYPDFATRGLLSLVRRQGLEP